MDDIEVITVTGRRSYARQPRGIVKLNGTQVDGWISWSVTNNSFFEADTFRVSFASSRLPQTNDANWFSDQKTIFCEIFAGFPQDPDNYSAVELTSLIYGRVDESAYDPVKSEINLNGRDLAGQLIDSRLSDEYVNQRASSIASVQAQNFGLTPVITASKKFVGIDDGTGNIVLNFPNGSAWDLLAKLAKDEGYVLFVRGQSLYFEPDPTDINNAYAVTWHPGDQPNANAIEIELSRILTVARGITVTAKSPNLQTGKPVIRSYPSNPKGIQAGKAQALGGVQAYTLTLPAGKTPAQVQQAAQIEYEAIVSHEMKLRLRLPGDVNLTIQTPIKLSGTGTAFDQPYFIRSIERSMSIDEGFSMEVHAQNVNADISPES